MMKTLITALILSTLTGPVLALTLPGSAVSGAAVTDMLNPNADELGRRSGRCPRNPEPVMLPGQVVAREGSTCGGV